MNMLRLQWTGLVCTLGALAALAVAPLARAATTNFFEGFEAGLTNWVVGDGNTLGIPAYWGPVNSAFGVVVFGVRRARFSCGERQ